MWLKYDHETDPLVIRLDPGQLEFRNELYSGDERDIVLDIDAEGRVAGFEILNASTNVNLQALLPLTGAG